MKMIYIALKDLTRSFRSAFALVFMFVVPLLVTGMFYLMFGSTASKKSDSFELPATRVVVANLDQGSNALTKGMAALSQGAGFHSMGEVIVTLLESESFSKLVQVTVVPDAASATRAVDSQQAGIALIIPEDFSTAYTDPQRRATLQFYQDPALTTGADVVKSILNQIIDGFSGTRIAVFTAVMQSGGSTEEMDALITRVVQQYTASQDPATALLDVSAPAETRKPGNLITRIVGPIMGGMLIFFAFFTGGYSAQTILIEDEEGTLPRLFTTPTKRASVLGGKFLAVGLTVLVQVTVLLLAANLVFGIQWGAHLPVALTAAGIIVCAAAFGIFITSLLKSTRQGGVVYGGLVTVTGMIGMMTIFTGNSVGTISLASLVVPQGWAVRGLLLTMNGAVPGDAFLNLLALLAWSLVFFVIGILRFQKRYA